MHFRLFWAQITLAAARAISGPKTGSIFNPTLPMARVMSLPRIKIIKAHAILSTG